MLLSSLSVMALLVSGQKAGAAETCTLSGTTYSCDVAAGNYNSVISHITQGDNAGSHDNPGVAGDGFVLTNSGTFTLDPGGDYVVYVFTGGGNGYGDGPGGAGGDISYTANGGGISLTTSTINYSSAILLDSYGGSGASQNTDNNSPGGTGGAGGDITVVNNAPLSLVSTGEMIGAGTLRAVSYGGAGGNGNDSIANTSSYGGTGGAGGTISISNSGSVSISGSAGLNTISSIQGLSAGGAGGEGDHGGGGAGGDVSIISSGLVSSAWNFTGAPDAGEQNVLVGIWGQSTGGDGHSARNNDDDGGAGGSSGDVFIQLSGTVNVAATGSVASVGAGVFAETVGGAGGAANTNSTGGTGGTAGSVTVTLMSGARINVSGDSVVGVAAGSFAGRGGDGQDQERASDGGDGGTAEDVTINAEGAFAITTTGDAGYGLIAQSVGGISGVGGSDSHLLGSSGAAGYGGQAGDIIISGGTGSSIITQGDFASGIVAQSIGGGGGTGGNFTSVLGGSGGNGGNGGNAGSVSITNNVAITTAGDHAFGILGQSIGGSGGSGGIGAGLILGLGGDGGAGGTAGAVTIDNEAAISTSGYGAHAIVGQSIAGGGGAAGTAGGFISIGGNAVDYVDATTSTADMVIVQSGADLSTDGNAAVGIVAQAIGGGGGSGGGATGVVSVGGQGAGGGQGGKVTVSGMAGITTLGNYSFGVLAQSIGGGGGNGGDVLDFSIGIPSVGIGGSADGGGSGNLVTISNDPATLAASGVSGDIPAITSAANISTSGDSAIGIIAQSIGGGGGSGGDAGSAGAVSLLTLSIGGAAGDGGNGGAVNIVYDDLSIHTLGNRAAGILAQSIGGGGGNGGSANSYDASIGFSAAVDLGGSGGSGGAGSSVTIDLSGARIITGGADLPVLPTGVTNAYGLVAQSIGGGGGNGGSASSKALTAAVPTGEGVSVAVNLDATVGGKGGSGGAGGVVDVTLDQGTLIETAGQGSHAIVAQSIGGGGGTGGDASSLSMILGDGDSVEATVSANIGGRGGNGGTSNTVTVDVGGNGGAQIITLGDYANGILAQSISGGGGDGGIGSTNTHSLGGAVSLDATIGLGGSGGLGYTAGNVVLNQQSGGAITTYGSGSRGMVGQSIGGGGGTSQGGTMLLGGGAEGYSGSLTVGMGMTGGAGGAGGTVTATAAGSINTYGDDADGILLQSIGGGGGLGGSAGGDASADGDSSAASVMASDDGEVDDSDTSYNFNVDVGGKGGLGGGGGVVNLTYLGRIVTSGDRADGIVLQSIGGGGGAGGSSTASGSEATASINLGLGGHGGVSGAGGAINISFDDDNSLSITTSGYMAYGVLAQSIGGGGGQGGDGSNKATGGISIGGGFGGSGGASGNGGTITIEDRSWINITTNGDDAHAVVLQSIGGGGGVAGAGNSTSSGEDDSHSIELSVGGAAGAAGNGGNIDVQTGAAIRTYGERAFGFVAQSVGGGGGIGGAGSADSITSLTLGGQGGAAGEAGSVNIDFDQGGTITTSGTGAHALVAQSIGGGGGIGGDASGSLLSFNGNSSSESAAFGNGGPVVLDLGSTSHGLTIRTSGANAFGVIAQSIGGGGGLGGYSNGGVLTSYAGSAGGTGNGGDVTITQYGTISVSGENSIGIFAQSVGGPESSDGEVKVIINGAVGGGTGTQGAAIHVDQGNNGNAVTVNDGGSVTAGEGSLAIAYTGSAVLVLNNSGTVTGSVDLENDAAQLGVFNNSGVANAGVMMDADIVNGGLFRVGSSHGLERTTVSGNYVQTGTGTLGVTVDFANYAADLLTIEGDAQLAGGMTLTTLTLLPQRRVAFLSAEGAVDGELNAAQSPIYQYGITRDAGLFYLSVDGADFGAASQQLGSNQLAVADHLQQIWNAGGTEVLAPLFAELGNAAGIGRQAYGHELADMSPGVALAPGLRNSAQMQAFTGSLMSCPVFEGQTALLGEGSCGWARVSGQRADQKASGGVAGFVADSVTYQIGGQKEILPGWFAGLSGAYVSSRYDGDDSRVSSDGNGFSLGGALKHEVGAWLFGASIGGSYGSFDTRRQITIPGYVSQAESSPELWSIGTRFRAAHNFAMEKFYLKPYADVETLYLRTQSYSEQGAGPLDLLVAGNDKWMASITPALEVGGRVSISPSMILRPYAHAGVIMRSAGDWTAQTRLRGAPGGIGNFTTSLPIDRSALDIGAGFQLMDAGGVDVRLEYMGEFSSNVQSNGGSLRVSTRF